MTASIIHLKLILVAQLCINLQSPLMIDAPPPKRARYAPNLLPATIYVASEKSVSTLTITSDLPDTLPTDGLEIIHVLRKGMPVNGRFHRGYCCRKHSKI